MHVLTLDEARGERAIRRPYAAVMVEAKRTRGGVILTVVPGSIFIAKADVLVVPLPKRFRVVDPDGNEIEPAYGFAITTETFDPCHGVFDIDLSR